MAGGEDDVGVADDPSMRRSVVVVVPPRVQVGVLTGYTSPNNEPFSPGVTALPADRDRSRPIVIDSSIDAVSSRCLIGAVESLPRILKTAY